MKVSIKCDHCGWSISGIDLVTNDDTVSGRAYTVPPKPDPAPVIEALRGIANMEGKLFQEACDGDYHEFKLWAQNVAQAALRAYDKENAK